jgi:hypothetical protein
VEWLTIEIADALALRVPAPSHPAVRYRRDCDPWSEPISPWHVSWQDIVLPDFAEVVIGPHRADIVGNSDTVVELQHSSINSDQIREREDFYGNMVWLFDATRRFSGIVCGDRYFFSLGRTKHLGSCQKPVFLDFFTFVVQVEEMTSVLDKFSGFGIIRDRSWFVEQYLSERRSPGPFPAPQRSEGNSSYPWPGKHPYRLAEHASRWMRPDGQVETCRKTTPYIPLNYDWVSTKDGRRPVWADIITKLPQIANGWERSDLEAMKDFLHAQPMIIGGQLRLMPPAADRIQVTRTVRETESLLARVDSHVQAGRIPVLKDETRQSLLARAEQFEVRTYGGPLASLTRKPPTPPPTLFD